MPKDMPFIREKRNRKYNWPAARALEDQVRLSVENRNSKPFHFERVFIQNERVLRSPAASKKHLYSGK
jgi:hypothetical protein